MINSDIYALSRHFELKWLKRNVFLLLSEGLLPHKDNKRVSFSFMNCKSSLPRTSSAFSSSTSSYVRVYVYFETLNPLCLLYNTRNTVNSIFDTMFTRLHGDNSSVMSRKRIITMVSLISEQIFNKQGFIDNRLF